MIEIIRLHKSYGQQPVLRGIDLRFEPGQVHGIVGANGAGKTTLFRCIAGLISYAGEVRSHLTPLKNHLGWLPTNPYFLSHITGREYLQLLLNARRQSVPNLASANLFELPLDRYATTYSTGMQKKLALTAILLQHNDYFILDEPFNGVDIQSNLLITEIIGRLRSLGKVVLLSSHIFSTLTECCDAIHLLEAGRIKQSVPPEAFARLGEAMKASTVAQQIDRLNLR